LKNATGVPRESRSVKIEFCSIKDEKWFLREELDPEPGW
jgi:hypothetical protein